MLNILVFQILSKRHYREIQFWGFENVILSHHDRSPPQKKSCDPCKHFCATILIKGSLKIAWDLCYETGLRRSRYLARRSLSTRSDLK